MSGCEQGQTISLHHHFQSRRTKVILTVVTSLCVVMVTIGVCVALFSPSSNHDNQPSAPVARFTGDVNQERNIQVRSAHQRNRRSPSPLRSSKSRGTVSNSGYLKDSPCSSQPSNDTIPAAHIKGHGGKFHPPDEHSSLYVSGYQQRWRCFEQSMQHHAFVDGGMSFNQTDKSLRVPTCGYYHVISQILFQLDRQYMSSGSRTVYHLLKFERNCSEMADSTSITVLGKTSIGPFESGTNSIATTHTSDIIKLCAGGRIWIEIPEPAVPCCPTGDDHGTFLGAVLVSPTNCHWPPTETMDPE